MARVPAGHATDSAGGPVIDPTKNVDALVEAAVKRLDDLRAAEALRVNGELRHMHEMAEERAAHAAELRQAETDRINAIRAVDVGAVNRASDVAGTVASALAAQVAASAETLRSQVAAAATAQTVALAAEIDPLKKDIADLRRAQYEAQGVKAQTTETGSGTRAVLALIIAAVVGFSTIVLGISGIAVTLILRG